MLSPIRNLLPHGNQSLRPFDTGLGGEFCAGSRMQDESDQNDTSDSEVSQANEMHRIPGYPRLTALPGLDSFLADGQERPFTQAGPNPSRPARDRPHRNSIANPRTLPFRFAATRRRCVSPRFPRSGRQKKASHGYPHLRLFCHSNTIRFNNLTSAAFI